MARFWRRTGCCGGTVEIAEVWRGDDEEEGEGHGRAGAVYAVANGKHESRGKAVELRRKFREFEAIKTKDIIHRWPLGLRDAEGEGMGDNKKNVNTDVKFKQRMKGNLQS